MVHIMAVVTRAARKTRIGIVVSDKMDKTITIKIDRTIAHPTYGRVVRVSTRLMAHDERETHTSVTGCW